MTGEEKKSAIEKLFDPKNACKVSDREIFGLGFHTKLQLEKYLLSEFYDVTSYDDLGRFKSSFTKRKSHVWKVVKDAAKRIRAGDNHFGIYALSRRFYSDVLAYITASSVEEATLLGNIVLGYLIPKNSELEATFYEFGSENSIRKNELLLDNISIKLTRRETTLDSLKKEQENLANHKKTLQIIIDQLKEQNKHS